MNSRLTKTDKHAGIAVFIGLTIRLLAIPFSMTTEADAVSRTFMAIKWLSKPTFISHGAWGPLHTYLIAGILVLWNDPVYAPALLSALFSAAVAIPLYLFVKREWNAVGGLFVTCVYAAYPVAIRNGLMAVSETPFIFFIAWTLLHLSLAKDGNGNWKHALAAGILLTAAASLRYEAWVLILLFGALLWKKWKAQLVFLLASLTFPTFWSIGNYLYLGDAFYGISRSDRWNLITSAGNQNLTIARIVDRSMYLPNALFFGITPLAFLVCLAGILLVLFRRRRQWIWLIPLFGLLIAYTVKMVDGSLVGHVRYSLALAILILPFGAEWFGSSNSSWRRLVPSMILIGSMIPLSYLRWSPAFPIPVPIEIAPIPRLHSRAVRLSSTEIEQEKAYPGGLLLDFFGWEDTYYVALMSRKLPSSIYFMPGEVNQALDVTELNRFLDSNPTGIMLLTSAPRFMYLEHTSNSDLLSLVGVDRTISVEALREVDGITFNRYSLNP